MTAASRIRQHIFLLEEGKLFSARHFLHYGSRTTVDKTLHTLEKKEMIRRITRGIYMRENASGWRPGAEQVAYAKAWFFCRNIIRCPNSFEGCSTEPNTLTFLTNRGSTSFVYDGKRIEFKAVGFKKFQKLQREFAGFSDLHAKHHDITAEFDPDLLKRHLADKYKPALVPNAEPEIISFDPFAPELESTIFASAEASSLRTHDLSKHKNPSNLVSIFPGWLKATLAKLRTRPASPVEPYYAARRPVLAEKNFESGDYSNLNFERKQNADLEIVTGNVFRLPKRFDESISPEEQTRSVSSIETPFSEEQKAATGNEVVQLFSSWLRRLPEND